MHYEINDHVKTHANPEVVGVVVEVLPGGLQNYVKWPDGQTTMEYRDDMELARFYVTNDYGVVVSGGFDTEAAARKHALLIFDRMNAAGTPIMCPGIVCK